MKVANESVNDCQPACMRWQIKDEANRYKTQTVNISKWLPRESRKRKNSSSSRVVIAPIARHNLQKFFFNFFSLSCAHSFHVAHVCRFHNFLMTNSHEVTNQLQQKEKKKKTFDFSSTVSSSCGNVDNARLHIAHGVFHAALKRNYIFLSSRRCDVPIVSDSHIIRTTCTQAIWQPIQCLNHQPKVIFVSFFFKMHFVCKTKPSQAKAT